MSEKYKFLNTEGIYFTTITIVNWIDLFKRADYSWREFNAKPSSSDCKQKRHFKLHEIFCDWKKFTADEIISGIKQINESRREWIVKPLIEAVNL